MFLLFTSFLEFFFLFLVSLHSIKSSLMAPTEQAWCVNVGVSVILIIRDLSHRQ